MTAEDNSMTSTTKTSHSHLDWEYAPAPESAAIGRLRERYQMYIGGRFVDGRGDDVKTINPANEEALATVSTASTSEPANSRSSRPWTTASRSRSPVTSTCRPHRRISSITQAGPTSSSTPVSGRLPHRWALQDR